MDGSDRTLKKECMLLELWEHGLRQPTNDEATDDVFQKRDNMGQMGHGRVVRCAPCYHEEWLRLGFPGTETRNGCAQ